MVETASSTEVQPCPRVCLLMLHTGMVSYDRCIGSLGLRAQTPLPPSSPGNLTRATVLSMQASGCPVWAGSTVADLGKPEASET